MSKGQKPMIGARVPHSWKHQIEDICEETGKTESEVVQEALPSAKQSYRAVSRTHRPRFG